MLKNLKSDLAMIRERDPAARSICEIMLCYPGFQAIAVHRLSHRLWKSNYRLRLWARIISHITRVITGIEIHPGAQIGNNVFIDHGMGVVIGETTIVGNRCLLYQGVTLGGTGKGQLKRHPTLKEGVVVGAGAKVLGNITIGSNTRIGAGSVVVRDVESECTVVGIPGRVIHQSGARIKPLNHSELPDAEGKMLKSLMDRIDFLETELRKLTTLNGDKTGPSQNIKDKIVVDYIGDEK